MLIFGLGGVLVCIDACLLLANILFNRRISKVQTHTIDVEQRSKDLTHIG